MRTKKNIKNPSEAARVEGAFSGGASGDGSSGKGAHSEGARSIAKSPLRYAAPAVIALVAVAFALLLVYPLMTLSPHGIPVAVCSLDEGVTVGDERINAGDELVERLQSLDSDDVASGEDGAELEGSGGFSSMGEDGVEWTVFDSEEDMQRGLDNAEFYAAITIPEDFSARMAYSRGYAAIGAQLADALPGLAGGASALSSGAGTLASGAEQLAGGVSQLESGASSLSEGASALVGGTGSLANGAASLESGLAQVQSGANSLSSGLEKAQGATSGTVQLIDAAQAALAAGEYETAAAYLEQASQASAGADAAVASLADGAQSLSSGVDAAAAGAQSLSAGAQSVAEGTSTLSEGASALASGTQSASSGASSLASGSGQVAGGAATLSSGLDGANGALNEIPVPDGVNESDDGTDAGEEAEGDAALSLDSADDGDGPRIALVINPAKNPLVTNSLESALGSLSSYGIAVDTTYTVDIPDELSSGYAHMPLLIITYLASYAAGVVAALLLRPFRVTRGKTARALLGQVACAFATALVIGAAAAAVFNAVLGAQVDFASLALFLALCSFALQLIVVGSLDLFGMPGMVVPLLLMALCMIGAYLPYEFLPSFWQECIYPYNPLRMMVDGFKEILYLQAGFVNGATASVALMVPIGAALMVLSLFKRPKGEGVEKGRHRVANLRL